MMYFDLIGIFVDAYKKGGGETERFGRVIPVKKGLTIIAGDNTSGKTTLAKCFYYILGVEEILDGKQNASSMDKSVYITFDLKNDEGEMDSYMVERSCVFAQLSNSEGKVITVRRMLKNGLKKDFNEVDVYECAYKERSKGTPHTSYYLHGQDDHNENLPFGYYQYLAKFAGLPIEKVPTRNGKQYDLYLQTLFALDYVEQTRGWTDYFAAIRGYNFLQPKQRIVEYALGLGFDEDSVTKKQLGNENEQLKEEWHTRVRDIVQRLTYNNMMVSGLSDDIAKQKGKVDDLQYAVIGQRGTLSEVLEKMGDRIEELNAALRKTDDQRFDDYNEQLVSFKEKEEQYDNFYRKLQEDYNKKDEIVRQILNMEEEIDRNRNISHVTNLLNSQHVRICPTCHRALDVTDEGTLKIEPSDIENNIRYLTTQKNFLGGLLESLTKNIEDKEIYLAYYKKILMQEKQKLNTAYAEVADYDDLPSEQVMMEMTDLKLKLASYKEVGEQVMEMVEEIWPMKTQYDKNKSVIKELRAEKDEMGSEELNAMLKEFRKLLDAFRYGSNDARSVTFFTDDKNSNYLYLPQALVGGFEEHLRSVSSASDFVRSVWAYYLALMKVSKQHPGFLLFDEPCQHSINEIDLKTLFEKCSVMNQQIILFCSSEPKTEETVNAERGEKNAVKTNIQNLVKNLDKDKYFLYQMKTGEKAIAPLG